MPFILKSDAACSVLVQSLIVLSRDTDDLFAMKLK
jgi:hypothetical protein